MRFILIFECFITYIFHIPLFHTFSTIVHISNLHLGSPFFGHFGKARVCRVRPCAFSSPLSVPSARGDQGWKGGREMLGGRGHIVQQSIFRGIPHCGAARSVRTKSSPLQRPESCALFLIFSGVTKGRDLSTYPPLDPPLRGNGKRTRKDWGGGSVELGCGVRTNRGGERRRRTERRDHLFPLCGCGSDCGDPDRRPTQHNPSVDAARPSFLFHYTSASAVVLRRRGYLLPCGWGEDAEAEVGTAGTRK